MRPSWNLPEDVDLVSLPDEEPAVAVAPRKAPSTPGEWIKENLFSSWFNTALTIAAGLVVGYFTFRILRWAVITADWGVVKANLRVYMIGRFPLEEAWRIWASLYLVSLLGGVSWGAFGHPLEWTRARIAIRAVGLALLLAVFVYLLEGLRIWLLVLAVPALFSIGLVFGRARGRRLRVPVVLGWAVSFVAVLLVLQLFGGVPPRLWGGFVLNILVAVVAVFLSFPFGILLALGRRSSLPVVSAFCVAFIELFRGVPLVTLIIAGQFILPLMLPPGMQLSDIATQMLVFTIFSSAYVAEIVRGGLQGVDAGQFEAARAVGLSTTRTMGLVILPQALRSTIPSLISHFISLFKDTSLLAALAITDLLRAARRASAQLEFIGDVREALLAAAVIFWIVAFAMARWSQRLERRLGVGER